MGLFGSEKYNRNEIFRRADQFRTRGRVKKAIREFEKILKVDPQDSDVHAKVAPLYVKVGRKKEAKASLRLVIDQYHRNGFVEKEIAMYQLLRSVDPRDLATYVQLVDLYLRKALKGDALKTLRIGRRAFRKRRFLKEAVAIEEKVLSIDPEDFRTQVSLVRHMWRADKRTEAGDRLLRMESQWAARKNKRRWLRTRWLLFRHRKSLSSFFGFLASLLSSPRPYLPQEGRRLFL